MTRAISMLLAVLFVMQASAQSHALPEPINGSKTAPSAAGGPDNSSDAAGALAEQRGFDYLFGEGGVAANEVLAARWFERAVAAGRPIAQLKLAQQLLVGRGVAPDPRRAFTLFRQAAQHGIALAQSYVGWALLTGTGVPADSIQARRWLTAAAEQGEAYALFLLSQIYGAGDGVPADLKLETELIERAAELGNSDAMFLAARSWLYGKNPHRNIAKGLYLVEQAAQAMNVHAAYLLGWLYLRGIRAPRDPHLAAHWLTKAADGGHQLAGLWLAELYSKGIGVDRDPERAQTIRKTALAAATIGQKNEFAWILSVAGDSRLRNGELAVKVMESALRDPTNQTAMYLDTLAAAYATTGQFGKAVSTEQSAIDALSPADKATKSIDYRNHLDLYRAGHAYRERL